VARANIVLLRWEGDENDGMDRFMAQAPGSELDLEVRILTVADVYDALTAGRVYREAWPVERALALLDDEADLAFDPECVAALRSIVVSRQPALRPMPVRPEPHPAPVHDRPGQLFGEAAA